MTIYWVAYYQAFTNLISQAADMARPAFIPNDLMANIDPLCLVAFIPIMDHIVFPWFAKIGFEFYAIRRITVGFFIGAMAMWWSSILQGWINTEPTKSVSVFWQVPCYVLIAVSESMFLKLHFLHIWLVFASIASYEYAYTHAPKSMKSVVYALSCLPCALAALIGILLSPFASNREHLQSLYAWVGIITALSGILFYYWFHDYDRLDLEYRFSRWNDKKEETIELVITRLSQSKSRRKNLHEWNDERQAIEEALIESD